MPEYLYRVHFVWGEYYGAEDVVAGEQDFVARTLFDIRVENTVQDVRGLRKTGCERLKRLDEGQ